MTKPHTSRYFEAELDTLGVRLRAMGERCERSLELALEAFWSSSPTAYDEVSALDRQIDEDEREIDALVLRTLALRQPVAKDLRVLTSAFKLTTDLERIGDEARSIAERAAEARGPAKELARADLVTMGRYAQSMLGDAVRSFTSKDGELARSVMSRDEQVDACYGRVLGEIAEYMRDHAADSVAAVRIIKVARYLERICDHATNIAEETIFAVRGADVRHRVRAHAG